MALAPQPVDGSGSSPLSASLGPSQPSTLLASGSPYQRNTQHSPSLGGSDGPSVTLSGARSLAPTIAATKPLLAVTATHTATQPRAATHATLLAAANHATTQPLAATILLLAAANHATTTTAPAVVAAPPPVATHPVGAAPSPQLLATPRLLAAPPVGAATSPQLLPNNPQLLATPPAGAATTSPQLRTAPPLLAGPAAVCAETAAAPAPLPDIKQGSAAQAAVPAPNGAPVAAGSAKRPFNKMRGKDGQAPRQRARKAQTHTRTKAVDLAPYTTILRDAIVSYPGQQAYLCEIYSYLEKNFACFQNAPDHRWKNSVRHNLSIHSEFQRVTPKQGERRRQMADAQSKGAAGFWTVIDTENMELNGELPHAGTGAKATGRAGKAKTRSRGRGNKGSRVSPKAASGGSGADTKPPGPAPAAQQQTVTAQPLAYSTEPGAWRAPGTLPMGLSCIAAPVKQHVRLGTMQSGLATATIKEAPTPETAGGSMTTCNSAGENVQQVANLLLLLSNSA